MNNIYDDIKAEMRLLDGDTVKHLKRAARQENVFPETMIWLLTDVFSNGHIKSRAYNDAPDCVIKDGVICERSNNNTMGYTTYAFTEKGKNIVNKTGLARRNRPLNFA